MVPVPDFSEWSFEYLYAIFYSLLFNICNHIQIRYVAFVELSSCPLAWLNLSNLFCFLLAKIHLVWNSTVGLASKSGARPSWTACKFYFKMNSINCANYYYVIKFRSGFLSIWRGKNVRIRITALKPFLFRFIEAGFLATSRTVTLNTELKDSAYYSEKFQFGFRWDLVITILGILLRYRIHLGSQQNVIFLLIFWEPNLESSHKLEKYMWSVKDPKCNTKKTHVTVRYERKK